MVSLMMLLLKYKSSFKGCGALKKDQRRMFYMWINMMFNRKDERRVEKVGPDRAAAEWIVRNGGSVRFTGHDKFVHDYNALPMGPRSQRYLLEDINAKGISLTDNGFEHLIGLQHLTRFNMNSCKYITNLSRLQEVANSLEYLDIGSCLNLADVTPVAELSKLKTLVLTGTLGKNRELAIRDLKLRLPDCNIVG